MSNKVTVNVDINGIKYPVSCISGEEDRLIESSQEVNKVIEDLSKVSGVVGETRLLAMTSLILADKIINKESSPDKDLKEANKKFTDAERYLDDLKIELDNNKHALDAKD